jgi:hypothetical protein
MGMKKTSFLAFAASLGLACAMLAGAAAADDLKLGAVNPPSGALALYGGRGDTGLRARRRLGQWQRRRSGPQDRRPSRKCFDASGGHRRG